MQRCVRCGKPGRGVWCSKACRRCLECGCALMPEERPLCDLCHWGVGCEFAKSGEEVPV